MRIPCCLLLLAALIESESKGAMARKESLPHQGRERSYYVHVPTTYRTGEAVPLVLVFHGGGGHARQIMTFTGFNSVSQKSGFIAVYPEGLEKHWNDGRKSEKFREHTASVDDVGFVRTLIRQLKKDYSLDERRVYSTGISNGGIFSQRLAIELADEFAAVASLAAQIASELAGKRPKSPVSVMFMNGTKDPFVPYAGGKVDPELTPGLARFRKQRKPSRGVVISTDAAVKFWLQTNKIRTRGTSVGLADKDRSDNCRAEHQKWHDAAAGLSVELVKVIGGGHTWPGKRQYLPTRIIGPTCGDFDGSEVVWDFFRRHVKRN